MARMLSTRARGGDAIRSRPPFLWTYFDSILGRPLLAQDKGDNRIIVNGINGKGRTKKRTKKFCVRAIFVDAIFAAVWFDSSRADRRR
jgi:hypothetical protein